MKNFTVTMPRQALGTRVYVYFKNTSRNASRLGSALTLRPAGGAVVNSLTREIYISGDPKSNVSRHRRTANNELIIGFKAATERKLSIIDVAIARARGRH